MDFAFDPLDFEFEDPIQIPSPPKKKKKLIGLDDLLKDYENEQKRRNERKSKQHKVKAACDAEDEFDDATEARLSECVDKCQKEISQINGDEEMPFWGIEVFGEQEKMLQQEHPELKNVILLQSFMTNDINSLVELNIEKEEFLERLLANGWLLPLVQASGCLEKPIAKWTFNSMLYSSKVWLMEAACEFWCAVLSIRDEANSSRIKIDWLPAYSDIERALKAYGFRLDSSSKFSLDTDMVSASDSVTAGPPQNIRSWIKYVGFCCKTRDANIIVSTQEAEEFLVIIISLFLDRQLLGLSMILHEALLSVINFFSDDEWLESCEKIAKSFACRLPCNINCLRVVETIVGVDGRSKQLRSTLAFQFLMTSLDEKVCDAEEILRSLNSINVKDKNCNLLQMFIYLNLAENWILFDTTLKDKAIIYELWGSCLRNCSSAITITDLRSFASNVRSKASYLLQGSTHTLLVHGRFGDYFCKEHDA